MKMLLRAGAVLGAVLTATPALAAGEVNVYSLRQPFLIQPLLDAFERETGIKVNVVFAQEGLVERLKREGRNSPADLIFTTDVSRLYGAHEEGVTQAVETPALVEAIPANLREPDGHWYALTKRARVVYASKDRVEPGAITSYEDLADPKWAGRICTRSGSHYYQIGLLGAFIAHYGEGEAEDWLRGVKANLARKPQGNDRAQVKAISEGECDIALGNNYYYGRMLADEEQSAWARSVDVVFPSIADSGTHINISGMALTVSAPNKDNAVKLMEFLAGDLAQQMYAEENYEYPVRAGVPWAGLLRSLGEFEEDDLALVTIAENRDAAQRIVDRVGYDE